jgi:hypothetical protein
MRKAWCCLVLAWSAGCVELPLLKDGAKPDLPPPAASKPARPPVTAQQVTEANAYQKAAALREELDREALHDAPTKSPP